MEIFALKVTTAATVEELTGGGLKTRKTSTAVFHQETLSVPRILIMIVITTLTARQEYYYPGTNHAMVTVLVVHSSRRIIVNMTAWLELTKSLTNKMKET